MVCFAGIASGGDIDHKDLVILGLSLEVDPAPVVANVGIPAAVQTKFGGRINDDAPHDNGLTAVGELSGPGIDTPIHLVTKPGHLFQLPALNEKGDYILRNIRLLSADGKLLQTAVPSFANITVVQALDTRISVRQLTLEELRARGITLDSNNYDVYEYTFLFAINGQTVTVPYSVIVDKRTHEIVKQPAVVPYQLPPLPSHSAPPRFQPPQTYPFTFDSITGDPTLPQSTEDSQPHRIIPAIPAAIVVPSGLGVLHQFFVIIVNVGNGAPAGSAVTIDSITATLDAPLGLRLAKTTPAVTVGQAVPIVDEKTGARFLVAAAQGNAEWSLEALKAGTHTVAVHVRATYKAPNQPDTALKGNLSASFVVSDPRFQVNFVHPETIRAGEDYTAFAFITNTSTTAQTVRIDPGQIPVCSGDTSWSNFNVCFPQAMDPVEGTIERGKTLTVPYHLKSRLTGSIFASAGTADDNVKVGVSLSLGVSASGIPLSPATLLMPWYTRYVDPDFVAAQMTLFGLGYSLATAPLNDRTALLPRVIPNDIFTRAQDIARAGERIFIRRADANVSQPLADRDPLFDLSLDLLGNVEQIDRLPFTPDLKEWDALRRSEDSGRTAAAAMTRQLEAVGLAAGKTPADFANDFAAATAHRSPYLLAIVHGATVNGSARPYAMTVTGRTSHGVLGTPAEAAKPWARTLPFAEETQFHIPNEYGELALIGRWSESLQFDIVPASSDFAVELIYPAASDGSMMRASFRVTNASSSGVSFLIDRGITNILVTGGTYVPVSGPTAVAPAALAISGAAQDLHLNDEGRTVLLLLNRPVTVADTSTLRDLIALTTDVTAIGYHARRRNSGSKIYIPGAALQDDGRILNVYFDKTLSKNAAYTIDVDNALVPDGAVHPRIDIATPAGLLYGKVLRGDNTAVADSEVTLRTEGLEQFDTPLDGSVTGNAADTGRYLFEYIPRDDASAQNGAFHARAFTATELVTSDGVIRAPGELQQLNLVFIGRGTVTGVATYSDGRPLAGATVVAGSAGYNNPLTTEMKTATTAANGSFTIGDLPVGPFTLSVSDAAGNVTFAANQIHAPGEVLRQDLVVRLRPFPGTGTVRVTVRRSDVAASDPHSLVGGAHVGVFSEGYGLVDGFTDAAGRAEFTKVPAGTISILAANFDITSQSAAAEVDLARDSTIDQTLTLNVPNAGDLAARATLNGTVFRDDPFNPTSVVAVPGAIVTINGFASVTAGADGKFVYEGIPLALAGKQIVTAFDPVTGRRGSFALPTQLVAGANPITLVISSTQVRGHGTMRVRLFDAAGRLVSGYKVLIPGFPATPFTELIDTPGIYEVTGFSVPRSEQVLAVPNGTDPVYGDQIASGKETLDFDGQTAVLDLRLPGQGKVLTHVGCAAGVTDCNLDVHGPVTITYNVWNPSEQTLSPQDRKISPDANGVLLITKVPVDQPATVATFENPLGYASAPVELQFEGQQKEVFLTLTTTSSITGRVLNWDRQTPIAGALVHLEGGAADLGNFPTAADGTFTIPGVAAGKKIRVIAEYSIDGIFRTGSIDTSTPAHGGPVNNLVVILREQASVDGTIVDGNGAPVPLARYWARELSWPYQTHGAFTAPLIADVNGHFVISNVFQGGIHISAQSPQFQEQRGEFEGSIDGEANNLSGVHIVVGAGGTGTIGVTVYDGTTRVANAEVTLIKGSKAFDFGQSDSNGVVTFDNVPVGNDYTIRVISRALARAGSSGGLTVTQSTLTSVDIGLSILGVVSGSLVDTDTTPERPIAGGHVTLSSGNVTLRTTTDAQGNYRIDGVPEGHFFISGFDFESGRSTPNPSQEFILTPTIQELTGIKLILEPTASLNVQVFLPNDTGGPGAAAPLVDVSVSQKTRYSREQQGPGSGIVFPRLFAGAGFQVTAEELGGEGRTVEGAGSFAAGASSGNLSLTFATSGTVTVTVVSTDPNAASILATTKVTIGTTGKSFTLFPDASGNLTATGVPLGNVFATAVSQGLSASASATLLNRTVPLHLTLTLGRRISMAGHVEAEAGVGQPSVNTRVIAHITSSAAATSIDIEARTGADGNYSITGVPVGGTSVHFDFFGPDGVTRGATRTVSVPDGTLDSYPAPNVKLDATGPRVVSIDPASNSNSVAPNSPVTMTFTEPLDPASVNGINFRVIASDDSQPAPVAITTPESSDGQYRVRLTPTTLLKSNMTYTVQVKDAITDPSGNKMTLAVTTTFTTVDYTEPRIVSTTPAITQPVGDGTTFYLRFNKAIDPSVFASGGSALLKLEQLTGNHGTVTGSPLPISTFVDPSNASTLVVAPAGVALQAGSFYRITENGARDTLTPPNVQTTLQTFDFFSADHIRPVATIDAPAATAKLIAGVDYVATVSIVDEGTTHASTDISYVQWFDGSGKPLARATTAPYGYAVRVGNGVTSLTLKASAVDLSGNASDIATQTWEVTPNLPPQNIAITVPASAYVARSVSLSATFEEDGLAVTSALAVTGKHRDGTPYVLEASRIHRLSAQPIRRTTATDAWTPVQYTIDFPSDLLEADAVQFALTLTDADNQSSVKNASTSILADTIAPQIAAILPAGETHYKFGDATRNHYRAQVSVTDPESGVAHVTFVIDGTTKDVKFGETGSSLSGGVYTFFTDVDVTAKNVDTRIHVTATAFDYDANQTTQTTDVIYDSVNDGTSPLVWWLTPLDGALVAKGNVTLKLRVRATDDIHVDTVTFDSPLFATVTADRLADNVFESTMTFATPVDGSSFTINATAGDTSHQTTVPITIDQIVPDVDLAVDGQINSGNVATFSGKTVRIHGSGKKLYISVPVTLQNLIVADGAIAGNPDGTRIDLTVRDRLYVDGDSAIDVTGKGFLGGWAAHESGGSNSNANGVTLGNSTIGGAAPATVGPVFASGSYAGIAGADSGASTNATYGSITTPTDFGSGGAGGFACNSGCTVGGNGGGVVLLNGGTNSNDRSRFVIAGAIRADGQSGKNIGGAGSGGSINIHARALVAGCASRITANGGDDDSDVNTARGGGGGRIAAVISERWDVEPTQPLLQSRGGRNDIANEARAYVDAGAGTVFVKKPGEANGELLVSSLDERHIGSLHVTRSTPLSKTNDTLIFDAITAGPRALLRFDDDYTAGATVSIDPTAVLLHPTDQPSVNVVSAPPAGTSLIQGSTLGITYNAQSLAGVGVVDATVAPVTALALNSFDYPGAIAATPANIAIPANAAPGNATFKLRVTDRAGRSAETATTSYTIVANTAPVLDQFDVVPASMFAGHNITVTAAASDDLNVTALTLTTSAGTITPVTPTPNPATHGLGATFTITIPPTTPGGTVVVLTLKATDGSALTATQTKNVTILHDTVAPTAAAAAPSTVQEASGATFTVTATINDAEVGVASAIATFDGKPYPLTLSASTWSAVIPVPNVDGTTPVPKSLTVVATDYEGNAGSSATLIVNVVPLVDAAGPSIDWLCASPGAVYPAGTPVTVRVSATGASQANGVQSVQFSIDEQTPVAATSLGNNLYEITITPAAGATSISVRAIATSVAGNKNDALTTITLDATPVTTTNLIIDATNTTYDGTKSLLIGAGATVTITGPHAFRNLAVLAGGTLHAGVVIAERFFVSCNGTVDVTALGYPRNTAYPGAGAPANGSGGGHLGRGGKWDPMAGSAEGSIYRPQEAGGGGHASDVNANVSGGGALHITAASSAAIDGVVRANGGAVSNYGAGAGGSIWITTNGRFAGAGTIEARGGESNGGSAERAAGGGGAIALEYESNSGLLFGKLNARGGNMFNSVNGGAGTIYLRGATSVFGDLTIDSKGLASGITELPNFGTATVTAIPSAKTAQLDTFYIPPYFAGNYLQVTDAAGTPRGTWRIASITNAPSARAFGGFATIKTTDATAYDGYLLFSDHGYTVAGQTTQWIAARNNSGQWQFDNDSAFVNFTPDAGDRIFAAFTKNDTSITSVTPIACCAAINGVATTQLVSGELLANVDDVTGQVPYANPSELMLRPDAAGRGVVLASEPASVTLEDGADIRSGDHVRGAYRFDHLTVAGSRVQTSDLLLVTNPIFADASSKVTTANTGAPAIDASKVTFAAGPNGAVLNGSTGAVADPDVPLQLIAHDLARGAVPPQTFVLQNAMNVTTGASGGYSIARISNGTGNFGDSGASSIDTLTTGSVSFRASQTNRTLNAGFVVDDTTRDANEPTQNIFHIKNDATWEVWAAGATTSSASGSYTPATSFRIEKSTAIRWFVDGRKVYEITTGVPPAVRFDVAFTAFGAEVNSIILDRANPAQSAFTVTANADGSFSIPIEGAAGDAFTLAARDAHAYPATSAEVAVGTMPTIGVASVSLQPSTIAGGAKSTATVTLLQAPAAGGAIVNLSSSNPAVAPVPASITIPAGQTSATFTITTPSVPATVNAVISASYAGSTQTATLSIVHDANPPSITITAPASGTVFQEGASIPVTATIIDAEVGVKLASASIDGVSAAMTQDAQHPNIWTATLTAPDVDGTADVPKTITVTASDFENNAAAPASVTINDRPIIDALAPAVSWVCNTIGAMYPSGAVAKLQVLATPASGDSISAVSMTITDPAGTRTVPMVAAGGGNYTYDYTLPTVTSDTAITLRAVANTLGGKNSGLPGSLTIIAPGATVFAFSTNTTITAADTTYEGKTVLVTAGKLTIAGKHTFARLAVLNGASVTQVPTDTTTINRLDIAATNLFVACGGMIDVSATGFVAGRTWNNTTTSTSTGAAAGSHGGAGGIDTVNTPGSIVAAPYGSLYDPNEPGGGGATANQGKAGGGIARIQAPSIVLDGKIVATGGGTTGSVAAGAGGSIRIDTTTISGAGEVHADGGPSNFLGGGGGRVAIYFAGSTGMALNRTLVTAAGAGTGPIPLSRNGTAGTIYLRQLDGTGAKVADELIVDNGTAPRSVFTPLADLGTGTITAVNANVLTLSSAVPDWVAGSSIDIFDNLGAVIASYQIASSTSTTVTVTVPNGQTLNAPIGSTYRGSSKIAAFTVGSNATLVTTALHGDDMTLTGEIDTIEVRAHDLTLKSAAVRQTATTATAANALKIVTTGTLSVDASSVIDAAARGFLNGRTWNNTATGASSGAAAGSHGGTGGIDTVNTPGSTVAVPYGSLYDPNEPGGGGATTAPATNNRAGGGIVRIQAPTILLNGKIIATGGGLAGQSVIAGAGGSIRIDAASISGTGEVHADGGASNFLGGGGGRVAIYYTGLTGMTLNRALVTAAGAATGSNPVSRNGTAGTVYLRQLDGTGAKVTDELIVDNGATPRSVFTPLPDLGTGTITAVNGNVLTLSGAVPDWVAGSSIEILDTLGTVIATYEIASSTATTVTVIVPSGQTLNAPIGSGYRGSSKIATFTIGTNGTLSTPALHGDDMTLSGEIETTEIRAHNLTLKSASVRQTPTTATTTNALKIVASGTLNVDAASVIDAVARGFLNGRTWNNTTTGASSGAAAGSHGGTGGIDLSNTPGSTVAVPYGSLYDPNEPGGGGATTSPTTNNRAGGGIIRIQSPSIVLNGKINVTGGGLAGQSVVAGAGGSIRIDTITISGTGEVHADGGASNFLGGGGGRVAIYYTGLTGMALNRALVTAVGAGTGTNPISRNGTAGTVYLRQLDGTGAKVTDELIVDNGTAPRSVFTPLVDLGTGTITAVNGNVLTLSGAVPDWVTGSSIEILDALGTVIATYEITSSTATTVTVIVPNGQTLNAPLGSAYRGSTKIATFTVGTNGTLSTPALHGDDMTLSGEIETTEIRAHNLTLKSASVRQTPTTATTTNALKIVASGTLNVDAASVIDASARGFLAGRTWNNTTTGTSSGAAAGSHGATGGIDTVNTPGSIVAAPYGSLYDPNEPGGGGATANAGKAGGGIVRIQSPSIVLNGKINVTGGGTVGQSVAAGAGGSIRIDTTTISGSGEVHADGGPSNFLGGGGGRVAIYYSGTAGMALSRGLITAAGAAAGNPVNRDGGPGTVYLKRDTQPYGELIIDNGSVTTTTQKTVLTSVGTGTITSVSSSSGGAADTIGNTSASFPVPNLLSGNRIYLNADKTVLWPVRTNAATALTLDVSAAALTAQVGQTYTGFYRLDALRLRNAKVVSVDTIESLTPIDQDGVSTITANPEVAILYEVTPVAAAVTTPAPVTLSAIVLASSTVDGGQSVNATIVLSGPAPVGGASVALSTSNAALATVPAEVVVPEGTTTVAFTIVTAQTGSSESITITGIYGSTQSATLTISARPPGRAAIRNPDAQRKTSSSSQATIVRGAGK